MSTRRTVRANLSAMPISWVAVASLVVLCPGLHGGAVAGEEERVLEAKRVLAQAPKIEDDALDEMKVVLLADVKDHGPAGNGQHDYPLWQERWALLLGGRDASPAKQVNLSGPPGQDPSVGEGAPGVEVETAWHWPTDEQFETADVIVAFCYLDWTDERLDQVRGYVEGGGGLVLVHSATWTRGGPSQDVAEVIGVGGFELYRHGPMRLDVSALNHPICLGLPETVTLENDEPYWPPTPLMDDVAVLATSSEERGATGSTPKADQPMFWCYQLGKGRVFGCVPGHFSATFDDPFFRTLLLRGIAWAADESPYRLDRLVLRGLADSSERSVAAVPPDGGFQAGAVAVDVTPGPGVSMNGPISRRGPIEGVHDPLHARAIVLQSGETTVGVVVVDMCIIDREVFDEAKRIIHDRVGIPTDRLMMSATHSHATPRVVRIETEPADEAYREFLAERIAEAVTKAHGNLAPATVGFGSFDMPEFVACRRTLCEPGSVSPDPFGGTTDRVASVAGKSSARLEPAGPVDPQVSVLSLRRADGSPIAVLANYSVHYAGGYQGTNVSADYFGVFSRRLAEALDGGGEHPPPVVLMNNGTSGNTNSVRLGGGPKAPWEIMEIAGTTLAEKTLELLDTLDHKAPSILAMVERSLELGVRKPDADRLAWAGRVLNGEKDENSHQWTLVYADEARHLAEFPDRYGVTLQVLRVGEVAIAATPCEAFAETGLAIKRDSPFPHTFVISLANGFSGYLPPPEQHALGGYETWPARSSHLEIDAEPKIRDAILELIRQTADR